MYIKNRGEIIKNRQSLNQKFKIAEFKGFWEK